MRHKSRFLEEPSHAQSSIDRSTTRTFDQGIQMRQEFLTIIVDASIESDNGSIDLLFFVRRRFSHTKCGARSCEDHE